MTFKTRRAVLTLGEYDCNWLDEIAEISGTTFNKATAHCIICYVRMHDASSLSIDGGERMRLNEVIARGLIRTLNELACGDIGRVDNTQATIEPRESIGFPALVVFCRA